MFAKIYRKMFACVRKKLYLCTVIRKTKTCYKSDQYLAAFFEIFGTEKPVQLPLHGRANNRVAAKRYYILPKVIYIKSSPACTAAKILFFSETAKFLRKVCF